MNEVVNGLAAERTSAELAVIPRGTGVDFVRTFDIPTKLDDALRVVLAGRSRAIDLGRATYRSWSGETESSYFANVASAGMSGAIAKRVNESKSRFAKASYFLATFAVFARWQTSRGARRRWTTRSAAAACATSSSPTAATSARA